MIQIPLGLRHSLESEECVLFIGAGAGNHFVHQDGSKAPDGNTLAKELAEHFSIDAGTNYNLAKISKIVELRRGRADLDAFLVKRLSNLEPDESFQWFTTVRWKAIYTTNYDNCIERAYELNPNPPQQPISFDRTSNLESVDYRFQLPICHLHGAISAQGVSHLIITEDDYARFKQHRKMLFELLKLEFATSIILYIGYSNEDPNWKILLNEMIEEFYPKEMPHSYRVAPRTDALDVELLKAKGIETIDGTLREFVESVSPSLSNIGSDTEWLRKARSSIPSDLKVAFEKNPAAVLRLLNSWTYVNQAPFHENSNVYNFLRGDRANWALIGSREHFERDIEEQIYDDFLDYATGGSNKPKFSIILAPAGYGVSTLMMSLAVKLVQDRAGSVFMLKPGSTVIEGDMEFASTISTDRTFYFIDNAADQSAKLQNSFHLLLDQKRSAMLVLGERLNEWRQRQGTVKGKEYLIEPLSDPEIDRLIDCLAKHNELNALEHLSREMQIASIKKKHNKELLVAMREATEGKSFDAILEDEFRGIGDPISRQMYLAVCCFFQHGAYIRDYLLAELMEVSLVALYEISKDPTEGVIIFDCVDESRGRYVARARHRTIAKVVWERCGGQSDGEALLQKALSSLNLNYNSDKNAFEHFIRSDRLVDSISTLDGKISFFEKACQKDPASPYVRQHYARMLLREKKMDLALSQIDEAIRHNSRVRVLYHTKGLILCEKALSTDSLEMARRWLAKSEDNFRKGINMYHKDEYFYQGLSQLYFGWAIRCSNQEEKASYITKSEEIITKGLKVVNVRDGLWIQSSNIQKFLGKDPSYINDLQKAVRDSPSSIIARYLLGRAFRKSGKYQMAIDVLDPVILNHHEEFRAFVECALSMVYLGKPYAEAAAILKVSTLYGLSDPRFIATLGGLLFLDRKFTEAEEIFSESSKRDFPVDELRQIQFRPPNPSNTSEPFRINGKVIEVKHGYSFIDSSDYSRFICRASKYKGITMRPKLQLTFEVAFTAKGAVADNPKTITR